MNPDDAVAAHVLARGLLAPAQLEQARARLQAMRLSGVAADLAGVLAAVLPPAVIAELRTVGEEAFRRETTRFNQRGAAPAPGDVVGPYTLRRELGRGAMGVVFEAEDRALGRRVALKLQLARPGQSPAIDQRFLLEAEAAARLRHAAIVAVHGAGRDEAGRLWLAMDFVEGEPLDARIRRAGALPVDEAARVALEVARALAHAHGQGVLHRDLKPANIILRPDGRPLVMDFGLAKLTDAGGQALTRTGELLGTPSYMPPEQANGERADARADVWSLGATLYHLLVGAPPFSGESVVAVLQAVMHAPVPSPRAQRPEVPEALEAIVLRCLTRARDERYPSAAAVADDLQRFLSRGDTDAAVLVRRRRRRAAGLGVAGVALALGVVGGGAALLRALRPDDVATPRPLRTTTPRPAPGVTEVEAPPPAPTGPRWVKHEPATRPPGRWSHGMAYDARRGLVVVHGGHDGRRTFDDLWLWDGANWREEAATPRPAPRYAQAIAYDADRGRLVVHGGAVLGQLAQRSDLWEFDGERWVRCFETSPLDQRSGHVAVHDPARRRVLIFGGSVGDRQPQATMFGWDGEHLSWVDVGSASPPQGRRLSGLAWLVERDALAVVGANGPGAAEHWEWHPERGWRQLAPLPMGERHQPALLQTGKVLLMLCGARPLGNDAWTWNGERWTRLDVAGPPPGRRWQGAVWDPARRVAVLFGGAAAPGPGTSRDGTPLDDTWELHLE